MDQVLKSEILVVVLEKSEGVSTEEFAGLFHQIHGYQLKLSNYGYKSLNSLLNDMDDLFQVIDTSSGCMIKCISPSEHKTLFISGNSTSQKNTSLKSSNQSSINTPAIHVINKTEDNKVPPPLSVVDKIVTSSTTTGDNCSHKQSLDVLDNIDPLSNLDKQKFFAGIKEGTTHGKAVDQVNENLSSAKNQQKSKTEESDLKALPRPSLDKNAIMHSSDKYSVTNIPDVREVILKILGGYVLGLKCKTLKNIFKKQYKMDLDTCSQSQGYENVSSMLKKIPGIKLVGSSQEHMVCILKSFANANKQRQQMSSTCKIQNSSGKLNSFTKCVQTAEIAKCAISKEQTSKTKSSTRSESPAITKTEKLPSKPTSQVKKEKCKNKAGNLQKMQYASVNCSKGFGQKTENINEAQSCNSYLYSSYSQACVGIQKPQNGNPCNNRQETNLMCNAKSHHKTINPICPRTEPQDGLVNPSVKENIKDILQVHARGISFFQLQKCYLFRFREPICLNGFSTVKQLLMEMKDVVVIRGLGVQTLLFPISATAESKYDVPVLMYESNSSTQPFNSQPDNQISSSKKIQVVLPDGQSSKVKKVQGSADNMQFVTENTNNVTVLASAQVSCISNFANSPLKGMNKNLITFNNAMSSDNKQAGIRQELDNKECPMFSDTRDLLKHMRGCAEPSEKIIRPVQTEPLLQTHQEVPRAQAEKIQRSETFSSELQQKASETEKNVNKTDLQTRLEFYKSLSSKTENVHSSFMAKTAFSVESDQKALHSSDENATKQEKHVFTGSPWGLHGVILQIADSTQKGSFGQTESQSSLSQGAHTDFVDSGQTEHLSQSLQKAHDPNHVDTAKQAEHLSQSQLEVLEPVLVETKSYALQLLQKGPYSYPRNRTAVQTNSETLLAQQPEQNKTQTSVSQPNNNKEAQSACSEINRKMASCHIHNQPEESAVSTIHSQKKWPHTYTDNTSNEIGGSSSQTQQNYGSKFLVGHEQPRLSGLKPCQKVSDLKTQNHQQTCEHSTSAISAKEEEPSWQTHKEHCCVL